MNAIKKIGALVLVIMMAFSFSACSGVKERMTDLTKEQTELQKYVEEYGGEFIDTFKEGIEISGLECDATIEANGNILVMNVSMAELNDVPEEVKGMIQASLDERKSSLAPSFAEIKKQVSSLESVKINFNETDGDPIATIEVEV